MRLGDEVALAGDRILVLDDPQQPYRLRSGEVVLFAVALDAERNPQGRRWFVGALHEGDVAFGSTLESPTGGRFALLAAGLIPSVLEPWDPQSATPAERDDLLHRHLRALLDEAASDVDRSGAVAVDAGPVRLDDGGRARSARGVRYVKIVDGRGALCDVHPCDPSTGTIAISERCTLQARGALALAPVDPTQPVSVEELAAAVDLAHRAFWQLWTRRTAADEEHRAQMREATRTFDVRALERGLEEAGHVFERHIVPSEPGEPLLVAAARIVADADGVAIEAPHELPEDSGTAVRAIALASHGAARRITLHGGWHRRDLGPVLAFRGQAKDPVALVPTRGGGYVLVDPRRPDVRTHVDARVAASIDTKGYIFLRPLPQRPVGAWDLLAFGLRKSRRDLGLIAVLGFLGGILAGTIPFAIGILYGTIIPGGMRNELLTLSLALFAVAFTAAMTEIIRGFAIVRLQAHAGSTLQAAIMQRLLSLPASFFRRFEVGDLADRVMGIDRIDQYVSDVTLGVAISAIFSLVSFALVFYYDSGIGWVTAGFALIAILAALAEARLLLPLQREMFKRTGATASFVLQVLTGIAKIRIAGAQTRAFVGWLHPFIVTRRIVARANTVQYRFAIFTAIWPAATALGIIAYVEIVRGGAIAPSTFIAASAAFGQLLTAILALGDAFAQAVRVVPIYERARPLLQELPETTDARGDAGPLSGEIELRDLSFRYEGASRPTLDRIDVRIEPGTFVAIVGPSGSGKSTLLRLLLGFERPAAGSVLYDGRDLATLDLGAVRRQIGVVLQTSRTLEGSIFENVAGSRFITHDQAWDALRRVGIYDDVQRMPMKLETYLGSDGGGLSGGQRQRIAIAGAIATSPKIIFFDEATSALDNQTQATVTKSLEALQATRIVVAHRLTTIANADRILVLDAGRVVQDGHYNDLVAVPGPFAELVRRQTL